MDGPPEQIVSGITTRCQFEPLSNETPVIMSCQSPWNQAATTFLGLVGLAATKGSSALSVDQVIPLNGLKPVLQLPTAFGRETSTSGPMSSATAGNASRPDNKTNLRRYIPPAVTSGLTTEDASERFLANFVMGLMAFPNFISIQIVLPVFRGKWLMPLLPQ